MRADIDAWRQRKQYVRVGPDRNLAVVDIGGEGPAALLLHGYTDTSRSYQALANCLGQLRLIIPDLPGHGDSDEDLQADLSTLAGDMVALMATLDIEPALVIGHSFGSLLALEIARMQIWPDAKIVTLAGSAWPALGGLAALEPIKAFRGEVDPSDPFLEQWYAGPVPLDRHFLERVRGEAVGMPVRIWHHYLELLEKTDFRSGLGENVQPVLAISGDLDTLFDTRHADGLSRALPSVRAIRLADRGHNLHWEAPEEIARLITRWLDIA